MAVIALASAKGAPGVTTTALALGWAWPTANPGRRSLVVDADVAGSGIAPGLLQAHTPDGGGLLSLATGRAGLDGPAVLEASLALDEARTRLVLLGITDPAQARALRGVWERLAAAARELDEEGVDVLVDVGRLGAADEPAALLERADLALLVVHPSLASVAAARPVLRRLREVRGPTSGVGVVVIGDRPYTAGEVAAALDADVLHVLAADASAASVLSDGGSTGARFTRSALMRTAGAAATRVARRVAATAEPKELR